jgi:hypothetical protein
VTEQSPLERAVEVLVYAPLGLVFTAREELPRLIAKGRQGATGQVGMARIVGRFAVDQGQKEAGKMLRQVVDRLADMGLVPDPDRQASAPPVKERVVGRDPVKPTPEPRPEATSGAVPAVESLAIPGYDSLSAPQVVQRLDGLSTAELESVRVYEAATRKRKTILSRVSQLQSVT